MRGYDTDVSSPTHERSDAESDAQDARDGMKRREPSELTDEEKKEAERLRMPTFKEKMMGQDPARTLEIPPKDVPGRGKDSFSRHLDATSDTSSMPDGVNCAEDLRAAAAKMTIEQANQKYRKVSDAWDREHQGLVKEERMIMKKYASDAAELALNKQLSTTRIGKEADEAKSRWQEYGRRMKHDARVQYEIKLEDIDENISRGLMQVDAHKDNLIRGLETNESAKQRDLVDKKDTDLQDIKERKAEARTMVTMEGYHGRKPKREADGEYLRMSKKARVMEMDQKKTVEDDHEDMTRRFVNEAKVRDVNPKCMDDMIKGAKEIADLTKEKCLAKQITDSEDYKEGEVKK